MYQTHVTTCKLQDCMLLCLFHKRLQHYDTQLETITLKFFMHFLLGFVTKQSKKYLFTPDNASIKSDCF